MPGIRPNQPEHFVLQFWGCMSPHDLNPTPRTVDADVSAILVNPGLPPPAQSRRADADFPKPTAPRRDRGLRIAPFAWVNINFVVGSCLIAFFCSLFVSENVQHFRRRAHLADEAVYSKPNVAGSESFSPDPSQVVSNLQLNRFQGAVNGDEAAFDSIPSVSSLPSAPEDPTYSLPANPSRFADLGSANNSDSSRSNPIARNGLSRATSASSASSTSGQKSNSVRSSATKLSHRSSKQILSAHGRSLNSRESVRNPLAKSAGGSARQLASNLTLGNQHSHGISATQAAVAQNQTSMHAMAQSGVAPQLHGAMNPMCMEGGSLAQPALGGIAGNGFGGMGHHAGHLRR